MQYPQIPQYHSGDQSKQQPQGIPRQVSPVQTLQQQQTSQLPHASTGSYLPSMQTQQQGRYDQVLYTNRQAAPQYMQPQQPAYPYQLQAPMYNSYSQYPPQPTSGYPPQAKSSSQPPSSTSSISYPTSSLPPVNNTSSTTPVHQHSYYGYRPQDGSEFQAADPSQQQVMPPLQQHPNPNYMSSYPVQYYNPSYQPISGMMPPGSGAPAYPNPVVGLGGVIPKSQSKLSYVWWEDQAVQCYVLEYNGIIILRRSDNDMINATKLLNVKGITRGRRTGILKNEKSRHVIKFGSMPFIGVWIPLERAIMLAKREGTYEALLPLFDENIKESVAKKVDEKDLLEGE